MREKIKSQEKVEKLMLEIKEQIKKAKTKNDEKYKINQIMGLVGIIIAVPTVYFCVKNFGWTGFWCLFFLMFTNNLCFLGVRR